MGPLPLAPIRLSPSLSQWLLTVLAPGLLVEAELGFLIAPAVAGNLLTANLNGAGVVVALTLIFAVALVLGSVNRTIGLTLSNMGCHKKAAEADGGKPEKVVWEDLKKHYSPKALQDALTGLPFFAEGGKKPRLLHGYYKYARTYLRRIGDYSSESLETEINLWAALVLPLILPLPIGVLVYVDFSIRHGWAFRPGLIIPALAAALGVWLGFYFRKKVRAKQADEHKVAMHACFLGRVLEMQAGSGPPGLEPPDRQDLAAGDDGGVHERRPDVVLQRQGGDGSDGGVTPPPGASVSP